mmetsp:Transcript_2187/g.8492  ORF Transcript_2187/g.8492 Transcript_2187/m.8492 type:complete len:221 (-) Transcript_2187:1474-2136(-)
MPPPAMRSLFAVGRVLRRRPPPRLRRLPPRRASSLRRRPVLPISPIRNLLCRLRPRRRAGRCPLRLGLDGGPDGERRGPRLGRRRVHPLRELDELRRLLVVLGDGDANLLAEPRLAHVNRRHQQNVPTRSLLEVTPRHDRPAERVGAHLQRPKRAHVGVRLAYVVHRRSHLALHRVPQQHRHLGEHPNRELARAAVAERPALRIVRRQRREDVLDEIHRL